MGSHRAAGLIALLVLSTPAVAQVPGWQFSFVPGEGDRAAMGCSRDAAPGAFTCLAVRCEDDFSTGVYVHSTRFGGDVGVWNMTLDREARDFVAEATTNPYGARTLEGAEFLLDRLRHGTFVYLRHSDDENASYAFIDLTGSMAAITEALYWCAPRVPAGERNLDPDVDPGHSTDSDQRPSKNGEAQ